MDEQDSLKFDGSTEGRTENGGEKNTFWLMLGNEW